MTGSQVRVRRSRVAAMCAAVLLLMVPAMSTASEGSGTFQGADGLLYESAPLVMHGQDGHLFYGPELDLACGAADRLSMPMRALAKLATVIERSGRTVVFSIAPGKFSTEAAQSPALPHGTCDRAGIAAQNRVLNRFEDPRYLPLRRTLLTSDRQMYWKTDLHWTTVGGAAYAKALAKRLDRGLGARQRFRYGTETRVGLLAEYAGLSVPETVELASPAGPVKVRNARSAPPWSGYPEFTFENAWVSQPKRKTWPGHTLLLGDSFMGYALENLRPIFHRGRFMWFVTFQDGELIRAIRKADTVVIEVYQLVTPGSPLADRGFRRALARALHPRAGS